MSSPIRDNVESPQDLDAQARDWLVRLKSGSATRADLDRLADWRRSPSADAAFTRVCQMWSGVAEAMEARSAPVAFRPRPVSRRMMLAGGGAAAAAGVAAAVYLGSRSHVLLAPDETVLATTVGERRQVPVSQGVTASLNAATTARMRSGPDGASLELIKGEVMVTLKGRIAPFVAKLDRAMVTADDAQFLLRSLPQGASILCMAGQVTVAEAGRRFVLEPNAVLALNQPEAVVQQTSHVAEITAWRSGQYVYQDRPLAEVVTELNRHRKGKIVVRDAALGQERVSGVVHLDRIDSALVNVSRSLNVRLVRLPGDIVILG